jgi:hypothetical protein
MERLTLGGAGNQPGRMGQCISPRNTRTGCW